jgi:hypothetical protein
MPIAFAVPQPAEDTAPVFHLLPGICAVAERQVLVVVDGRACVVGQRDVERASYQQQQHAAEHSPKGASFHGLTPIERPQPHEARRSDDGQREHGTLLREERRSERQVGHAEPERALLRQ